MKDIEELLTKHLKATFPLYREEHDVYAGPAEECISIGYRTTKSQIPKNTTRFDLNLKENICYVLWVEIVESERGKGHGKALYKAIEDFAREYGCDRIRMNPSGRTKTRTRLDYLLSLNYHKVDPEMDDENQEVEKILV